MSLYRFKIEGEIIVEADNLELAEGTAKYIADNFDKCRQMNIEKTKLISIGSKV